MHFFISWRAYSAAQIPILIWAKKETNKHIHTNKLQKKTQDNLSMSKSKSKSKLYYDRRSAGQFVLEQSTHLGLTTRSLLVVWQLRSCSCGAPSLTRGRVCLFYVLLALASEVFLWSESLGTWDHLVLSHIWDFPFRRLIRLAGSRWRYSTPPPHGYLINTRQLVLIRQ
jgi:hypothetical protein